MSVLTAVYHSMCDRLAKGERIIGDDRFLDWVTLHSEGMAVKIRSIPNPNRVGLLDTYVIWIEV